MRLLICAGGTGGGVYPALAVLQAMSSKANPVLWVGGEGGMEEDLVKRAGIPYQSIPAAGVHGVGLRSLPKNVWQLARGTLASRRILNAFKPDVLLFTGGYVAVPMALAGRHIPTVLYVPDIEPGLALKTLSRFADRIALTAEPSREYYPHHRGLSITGYPTRTELGTIPAASARAALGLTTDLPALLVFGGSKGARSINRALFSILPSLLEQTEVIHISGSLDWAEVDLARTGLPTELASHYHAFPYLHTLEMGQALAAADLAVSRAGASTLGEYPLMGLPAILVPYPFAWRYQKVNADYLAAKEAAVVLEDAQLTERLLSTILGLIDQPETLHHMREQMRSLARPHAAKQIAVLIEETAQVPNQKRNLDHA